MQRQREKFFQLDGGDVNLLLEFSCVGDLRMELPEACERHFTRDGSGTASGMELLLAGFVCVDCEAEVSNVEVREQGFDVAFEAQECLRGISRDGGGSGADAERIVLIHG